MEDDQQPEEPVITTKLTRKQSAFVKHLIEHPKDSATKAVLATYDTNDQNTARSIATENLSKPAIQSELSKYNDTVEQVLYSTVNKYKNSDKLSELALAVDISKWIHDKIHGKATTKTEVNTTNVNLNIEASEELAKDFTSYLKGRTAQA